jgi:hypothetical protein
MLTSTTVNRPSMPELTLREAAPLLPPEPADDDGDVEPVPTGFDDVEAGADGTDVPVALDKHELATGNAVADAFCTTPLPPQLQESAVRLLFS